MKAIEEMQYEQRYLQELRGELSDEERKEEESDEGEVDEDGEPIKPKKLSEHEEFEEKLIENAEDQDHNKKGRGGGPPVSELFLKNTIFMTALY